MPCFLQFLEQFFPTDGYIKVSSNLKILQPYNRMDDTELNTKGTSNGGKVTALHCVHFKKYLSQTFSKAQSLRRSFSGLMEMLLETTAALDQSLPDKHKKWKMEMEEFLLQSI